MPIKLRLAGSLWLVVLLQFTVAAQTLLVAANAEHQVALVDPVSFATLAQLPTGQGPHEITVAPDGRTAYVVDSGGGPQGAPGHTVTALDLVNRSVKATFDLGKYTSPHDTRLSRDGRLLWVTCAPAETILELDAEDGRLLKTYAIKQPGAWFLAATPDGRKLYTANLEGKSISVIERATGAVRVIPLTETVTGIDLTPDGREVWVTSDRVHVIDTATDRIVASLPVDDGGTNRLRLTPDGRRAVVSLRAKNELAVFAVKTRRVLARIPLTLPSKVIAISADGRRAFLTNPADHQVTVVDLATYRQTATFATGQRPDGIAWAPGVRASRPTPRVDVEKEKAALLKLHQQGRQAHFQTDVELLLARQPEEFIAVSGGKIQRPRKDELRRRFAESFKGATYSAWDDLEPPIIRVANDGSMGWVIVRLQVRRMKQGNDGVAKEEAFVYAGITTYEKRDGQWVKSANVSTFE